MGAEATGWQRAGGRHSGSAHPVELGHLPREGPAWAPTCDGQGGARGLGATAAGVLARVLPAQAPQHQLRHAAPLTQLPALISLHLQATLGPDDGGRRLGELALQAGRGTLLSLQALQRLLEHHLWGCRAGIRGAGEGRAAPRRAQSPRQAAGTPNPARPAEGLGQACLTHPQDSLPQAPLEDCDGSGVTGQGLLEGKAGTAVGPVKGILDLTQVILMLTSTQEAHRQACVPPSH